MLNGIDISGWQGDIDLSKLDLDFVIVKATEGLNYVNRYCEPKVQQARSLGLKWGFYHFASGTDPIAEADWFVKNCEGYFGEGIPVLDFEADAVARGSEWARKFLNRVYERTGIRAMVYMSQSVTMEHDWSAVAKDHGLWVAKYPNVSHPGFDYTPDFEGGIGAWESVAIWQYASDGRIDGYDGNLDLNHAYMTEEQWDMYAGNKGGIMLNNDDINKIAEKVWEVDAGSYTADRVYRCTSILKAMSGFGAEDMSDPKNYNEEIHSWTMDRWERTLMILKGMVGIDQNDTTPDAIKTPMHVTLSDECIDKIADMVIAKLAINQ